MAAESESNATEKGKKEKELRKRWESWLSDEWYCVVVEFRLFKAFDVEADLPRSARLHLERKSAHFRLQMRGPVACLLYVERDGRESWCVHQEDVKGALEWAHDVHGHAAKGLTMARLLGTYYWPTRHQDSLSFCRSCPSCQFGCPFPPRAVGLRPVVHLQPMDLLGMDFLGPISPQSQSGCRYVLIIIDYFTRFVWARALPSADGASVLRVLQQEVFSTFGLPRA